MQLRFKVLMLISAVFAVVITTLIQPETALANGGYPDANIGAAGPTTGLWYDSSGSWSSNRGYAYRNCTDYVAWKLESLGVQANSVRGLGNANQWVDAAKDRDIAISNIPTYGSVAVSFEGFHGHVAFVEKVVKVGDTYTITTSEYNWPVPEGLLDGAYHSRVSTAGKTFTKFINFGLKEDWRADGTFVTLDNQTTVYRMLGGAPIRLTNWGIIPGCCGNVKRISQRDFDTLRSYPIDGSFMSIHEAGGTGIYRFVGGAPIRLYNWGVVPGFTGQVVAVNFGSLQALDHMRAYPEDGAMMSIAEAGGSGIYTFAGGTPVRLYNWGIIPNFSGATAVNFKSLEVLDHMVPLPKNGTFIAAIENGYVYRMAGGAPVRLYDQGSVPGFAGKVVWVNQKTIDRRDHMYTSPSNGTILQGFPSGQSWKISEGVRQPVSQQSNSVAVNDRTILDFPM